jgi:hypothetical protein
VFLKNSGDFLVQKLSRGKIQAFSIYIYINIFCNFSIDFNESEYSLLNYKRNTYIYLNKIYRNFNFKHFFEFLFRVFRLDFRQLF